MPQAIVCPKDGKDDQIQKVTAVVSDSSKGLLRARLGPPSLSPEPIFRMPGTPGPMIIFAFFGAGAFAWIFDWITAFFAIGRVDFGYDYINLGGIYVFMFIVGMFVGIFVLSYLISEVSPYGRKTKEERRRIALLHQRWETEKAHYPTIIHNWNKLYYCNRCDIVFIPNDPHGGRIPEDMLSLIDP